MSDIPEDLDITDELIAERRGGEPGDLPPDMAGWMRSAITWIDTFSLWCGRIFCWMLVPLMLAMVWEVLARKLFAAPTMWAYDVSRMLSGALFLVGAGYALMRGVHIRADFIYRNWAPRRQAIIDAVLYLSLFFPAMIFFLSHLLRLRREGVGALGADDGHRLDGAGGAGAHGHAPRCTLSHHPGDLGAAEVHLRDAEEPVAMT